MTKHKTLTHAHGLRQTLKVDGYWFVISVLNRRCSRKCVAGSVVIGHRLFW
jgi:hypothetical protein